MAALRSRSRPSGATAISVWSSRIGAKAFQREFVPRLFQRFARGSETSGIEGSGLGLTIAQAYARAHGGKIVYEEAVPHGARFEVVLPLRLRDESL